MRMTLLGMFGTPWEQPAPARIAYKFPSRKAMSATPLTRLPKAGLVWLEGRLSATVVRFPSRSILEMREPTGLPVYGPTGGGTVQSSVGGAGLVPPTPPSATYR